MLEVADSMTPTEVHFANHELNCGMKLPLLSPFCLLSENLLRLASSAAGRTIHDSTSEASSLPSCFNCAIPATRPMTKLASSSAGSILVIGLGGGASTTTTVSAASVSSREKESSRRKTLRLGAAVNHPSQDLRSRVPASSWKRTATDRGTRDDLQPSRRPSRSVNRVFEGQPLPSLLFLHPPHTSHFEMAEEKCLSSLSASPAQQT
ncbi:hypothetical protein Dda_9451 [Drechslerella dactyloides]|uniref:Uncharacterized protein n=1 Tax=Drechslerella dactyloides TaxID=74499 RepID=A0AAD6IRR6_DREDA|nr:hypothetical protein Dda_9451 [Drechslerella dactyloides]